FMERETHRAFNGILRDVFGSGTVLRVVDVAVGTVIGSGRGQCPPHAPVLPFQSDDEQQIGQSVDVRISPLCPLLQLRHGIRG
ncbi:MAG: hypothetical protein KY468_20595, partial [Armatimonadetes bacterium]|nr:hypothetical protein [Armatimonadota bacterium]